MILLVLIVFCCCCCCFFFFYWGSSFESGWGKLLYFNDNTLFNEQENVVLHAILNLTRVIVSTSSLHRSRSIINLKGLNTSYKALSK